MLVDLHVHTSRYSECGKSSPEEMMRRAVEIGLDGLVLTEHNVVWPLDEFTALQEQFPELHLYRGVEMTVDTGDHYLVYGVTDPAVFEDHMPSDELVRRVRALGGATVLAHPYRYGPDVPATLDSAPVDGIEIFSHNILAYAHEQAVALTRRLGLPALAASDGHHVRTIGLYSVRFAHNHLADECALARAVISGDFTLHADAERVDALNVALPALSAKVLDLIAQGLDNAEIHRRLGVGYTMTNGLRDGRDVSYPR